ncbi:MAG: RnfABCDGE type electron transport complex subunit G [Lachnospiraceae bacterium]|nr:RnfABCDGE type electron transport complex subunit G [Lachnospiraceae bacterium]
MKENSIIKDTLILTLITLVAGLALGGVQYITAAPIAAANKAALEEAYMSVFPSAASFEDYADFNEEEANKLVHATEIGTDADITAASVAKDSSGADIGYVFTVTTHKGYGGDITLTVGIDSATNKMNGYSITDISETPGLGMKSTEPKFMSQFEGLSMEVEKYTVTKSSPAKEGEIEAIGGATITSRAVTNAVNAVMYYYKHIAGLE